MNLLSTVKFIFQNSFTSQNCVHYKAIKIGLDLWMVKS